MKKLINWWNNIEWDEVVVTCIHGVMGIAILILFLILIFIVYSLAFWTLLIIPILFIVYLIGKLLQKYFR